MKNVKRIIFLMVVGLLLLPSCKRYEEGPYISFRFKESRVAGVWLFSKFEIDGISAIDSGWVSDSLSYVEFSKGGFYEVVNNEPSHYGAESGIWHFGKGYKGKDYLEVDKNDRVVKYYIIKLKNNNIKYEYDDKDNDGVTHHYEVHLIPKIL